MQHSIIFLLCMVLSVRSDFNNSCVQSCQCQLPCSICTVSPEVQIICLGGNHYEMGQHYGNELKTNLIEVLDVLIDYYVNQSRIPEDQVIADAYHFYNRYSNSYSKFLEGISNSSGISFDHVVLINSMVTLSHYIPKEPLLFPSDSAIGTLGGCAYTYVAPDDSETKQAFHLRNYDFHHPIELVSKHTLITVLHEENRLPVAIVGFVGQVYCPTCINSAGIFLELNNGMPSGGYHLANDRKSMLINMLQSLQDATTVDELAKQMAATESDYSLIINFGDQQNAQSFEFSSVMGKLSTSLNESFAITNYFVNPAWGSSIPKPTDNDTWFGVTRRQNLKNQLTKYKKHGLKDLKEIMQLPIEDGGANWNETILQMIYDTHEQVLHVRVPKFNEQWNQINLNELFTTLD